MLNNYSKYKYYANLTSKQQVPSDLEFKNFTILLNDDKTNSSRYGPPETTGSSPESFRHNLNDGNKEDIILKLGKLLKTKIKAHSGEDAEVFTACKIIQDNPSALVSVMFRLAAEDFVKNSKATFKIIECRNCTKLLSDWKPTLVDVILSLGHQVIFVELHEFPHCTDFSYSILRQINYYWKVRLPRSFFYPDDVCTADFSSDQKVVVVTPLMPDGDIDLTNRIHDNLKYEILMMLKESCASGLKNQLLKRDLRVGKFSDTENGVNSIRYIHRSLQRRIKNKGDIPLGQPSDDSHQILLSLAGESLMTAEYHLGYCKNPRPDSRGADGKITAQGSINNFPDGGGDGLSELALSEQDTDNETDAEEATFDSNVDGGEEFFDDILKQLKDIESQYSEKTIENEARQIPWSDTGISSPFLATREAVTMSCLPSDGSVKSKR